MRTPAIITILFLMALLPFAVAQRSVPDKWQVGIAYDYVHTNQPPDGCSCFSMNGGTASLAYALNPKFSLVGEFIGVTNGNVNAGNRNLNLYSYLGGPRYSFRSESRFLPYAQVLVGGAHGGGSLYSVDNGFSGSSNGFAMTAGGGLDVRLSPSIALRLFQADYLLTLLANHVNDRQNNFSLSTGIVFNIGKH